MSLGQRVDYGGAAVECLVEGDVVGEVGEQRRKIANRERGVDYLLQFEDCGERLYTGALRRATHERLERRQQRRAGSGVASVGQRDQADAGRRMPAHVRAEAGIAAGVADGTANAEVLHREQAEAVAVAAYGQRPRVAAFELKRDGGDDLLHLAAAGARERVVVGCVARRKGVDEALHPHGEVGNG